MPPIVGFVGFKGGSGKTLLAFQMAERAQSAGFRVLLWDLDPEQSAMHHMAWRAETDRPLWAAETRRIEAPPENELNTSALSDIDLVICDFPGFNTFLSAAYMDRVDLLLAPISTTAQDRTVMTRMGWLAQSRGWRLGGVVKRVCSRSSLPGVGKWPGMTPLSWHNGSPLRATA